jgi:hypothetical protein
MSLVETHTFELREERLARRDEDKRRQRHG